MQRGVNLETAANALGALRALAVVYLAGVLAGAFTARWLLVGLSIVAGVVFIVFGYGMLANAGWARLGRPVDDD